MRRVILWTCPRCVSTAFERCFIEIEGVKVFHEPYGNPFYYGPERVHDRFALQDKHAAQWQERQRTAAGEAAEAAEHEAPNTAIEAAVSTHTETKQEQPSDPTGYAAGMDTYDGVLGALKQNYEGCHTVFSKDMAYYLRGRVTPHFVEGFQHTFLMRHPCKTALSLWSKSRCEKDTGAPNATTGWTFFDVADLGFRELREVFAAAQGAGHNQSSPQAGTAPVVLDADDMLSNPPLMVQAYCMLTGLPYTREMLSWEPGPVHAWDTWPGWHDDALRSSGLQQRSPKPPRTVASIVAAMQEDVCTLPGHHEHYDWAHIQHELEQAVILYEEMYAHALTPQRAEAIVSGTST